MVEFFKKYKELLLFLFVYWCICFIMLLKNLSFLYVMLSWNTLLAILPLFFIKKAETLSEDGKTIWSIFWKSLWLLFFPNSVYMITDFIHISSDKFMWIVEVERYYPNSNMVYNNEILIWAKLLVIGMGFLFALLVGLESLYIFEENIKKKSSKPVVSFMILIVALLSGIGVYIGRFLRFNSWDILFNPIQLMRQVTSSIDIFAIQCIIIFTIYIISSYGLFKTFRRSK